jgi:hypothetical protein
MDEEPARNSFEALYQAASPDLGAIGAMRVPVAERVACHRVSVAVLESVVATASDATVVGAGFTTLVPFPEVIIGTHADIVRMGV